MKRSLPILLLVMSGLTLFGQANKQRIMWELQKDSCMLVHNKQNKGFNQEFNFLIKFSENKILLSNINASIAEMSHQGLGVYYYDLGSWYEKNDTIYVKILESGRMSTNTGMVALQDCSSVNFLQRENKEFRFVKLKSPSDKLVLIPLDSFTFRKKESKRRQIKYANTFNCLKIGQPFTLRKSKYSNSKMEKHLMRCSKFKQFF